MFSIEIREAGQWFKCTDVADTLEDALMLAGSYTHAHDEDAIRIITPDGDIL